MIKSVDEIQVQVIRAETLQASVDLPVEMCIRDRYAFARRDLATYIFLRTEFVFLDYSESPVAFYIDYVAMMGLFIWIAYYL